MAEKGSAMRIFVTRKLDKWCVQHELSHEDLREAVEEIQEGLFDADLGGGVIKKRIATKGRGKSGSVRTLVAFKQDERTFYILAFEKNELANVDKKELKMLKVLAKELLQLSDVMLKARIKDGSLVEITKGEK